MTRKKRSDDNNNMQQKNNSNENNKENVNTINSNVFSDTSKYEYQLKEWDILPTITIDTPIARLANNQMSNRNKMNNNSNINNNNLINIRKRMFSTMDTHRLSQTS